MLADQQALRWWGMDMRPRWRRRTLVLVTYLVIFAAISSIPAVAPWFIAIPVAVLLLIRYSVLRGDGLVRTPPDLDEREQKERDSAERWTLNQLGILLAAYTGTFAVKAVHHETITAMGLARNFFWLAVLALTLPTARTLWTEPDPREIPGEIGAVEQAGA